MGWVPALLCTVSLMTSEGLRGPASEELKALRKADQAARQFEGQPTMEQIHAMEAGDRYREIRVRELLRQDLVQTTEDFEAAALIMQHGGDPDDYLLARELALLAASPKSFSSLVALAEDRFLLSIGRKQRFGSQFRFDASGKPVFRELDESMPAAVTDGHRADVLIAPLKRIREKGLDAFKNLGDLIGQRLEKRRDAKWRAEANRKPAAVELAGLASRKSSVTKEAAIHRTLALYRSDQIETRESNYHAALVLSRSRNPETLLLANELAALSALHGYLSARPLFAETWDRFAKSIGRAERYGTFSGSPSVAPGIARNLMKSVASEG